LNKTDKVFERLPDKFNRQQVLETAKDIGLSYSGASAVPKRLMYDEKIERIGYGEYRKI